jgi:cyclopropane-fatty-acyl-phospholipid synthase
VNLYRTAVERILSTADVQLGGARPWDLQVSDDRFFRAALLEGSLGLGESYMEGWWSCADLEELVRRFIVTGVESRARLVPAFLRLGAAAQVVNRQTRALFEKVVRHYNLDNDLFCGFLGRYKNYSCAYFDGTDDLDEAQLKKMDLIGRKMCLAPGDRVLDVGGGWGEMARHMASAYGCHVTSINISDEQIRYAREHCKGASVDVVKCDYRDLTGTYDKIAVIAMLSHIGPRNYRSFMENLHRHLAPGGVLFVDTVGSNVSVDHGNPWLDKYIFPGIVFPTITQLSRAMEGLFVIEDIHNIGPSYTRTLRAWNDNFQRVWPSLGGRHEERTRRMFEFFFLAVAGFFRARDMQNWHLVMTRQGADQPACRVS